MPRTSAIRGAKTWDCQIEHSTIVTTQRFYIAPDAERDANRALADLSSAVAGSNGDATGGKQVALASHGNADDPCEAKDGLP
jgi:hypothetical protein